MKSTEYNSKVKAASDAELEKMLAAERKNLFTLRQQKAFRQLDNVHAIPEAKKNIARILTEMRDREIKG